MADFTLTAFPPGTDVEVYERGDFPAIPLVPRGEPSGTPVDTGTVPDSGALVVEGLDRGVAYVAYAEIDEQHRYVRFWVPEASAAELQPQVVDADGEPVAGKRLVVKLDAQGDVDELSVEDV